MIERIININLLLCLFFLGNLSTLTESAESLHSLPWIIGKGNWIILAKLYQNSDQSLIYEIREYIHSSDTVRGKISINSFKGKKVDIFYSSDFKNDRIVVKDGECHKNTFINNWSEKLFETGWTEHLLNHVLMTGPSILFRLDRKKLFWTQGPEKTVRGFSARSIKATFGEYLDIKCYFKKHKGTLTELSQADRIEFNGFDSSLQSTPYRENFHMDIFSMIQTDEELDKIVTVTPGLGCPSSLINFLSDAHIISPSMMGLNFHFFSTVSIDGPTKLITKNEMYVDSDTLGVSLRTTSHSGTTELLYDYNLGLIYELQPNGGCLISAIGPESPGIDEHRSLYAPEILYYYRYSYNYLGKVFLDHEYGYEVHVWEAINYNYVLKGNHYDKVVNTQYFVPFSDAKLFTKFILVRTTLNGYNKTSNGSYKLIETIRIDYYDLKETSSGKTIGTQSHLRFNDCYPDSKDRKTFAIHFDCKLLERKQDKKDKTKCIKLAEKHYSRFLGNIKTSLEKGGVSLARIANLDIIFDDQTITALVTILKVPNIKDWLPSSFMNVDQSLIKSLHRINIKSEEDCLQKVASMHTNNEVILYCEQDGAKICSQMGAKETITKHDNGIYCKIYRPFMKIDNYAKEIPLDKLESQLSAEKLTLLMSSDIDGKMEYKSTHVVDVTAESDSENAPFRIAQYDNKLPDDKVILVEGISTFGGCYRTCAHNSDDICETFSYCRYSDKVTCYISELNYSNLSSKSIVDNSCIIYSKNHLSDYVKIVSKRYKQAPSIAIDSSKSQCASLCSASDDCLSFQQCGSSCTFAGYYTDSLAKENDECDIYIPKVAHRFSLSGKKIVSEVFHTEFNLNLDQCASLCHGWVNDAESCLSFNYCPQRDANSSCSLTKYSVKDSSTKTIDSSTCQNYELKEQSTDKKQRNQQTNKFNKKVTSGGATFGYIICFLVLGFITGFAAPYTRQLINSIAQRVSVPLLRQKSTI